MNESENLIDRQGPPTSLARPISLACERAARRTIQSSIEVDDSAALYFHEMCKKQYPVGN